MTGTPVEAARPEVCPPVVRWSAAAFGAGAQVVLSLCLMWLMWGLFGILADPALFVFLVIFGLAGVVAVAPLRHWAGVAWKLRTAAACGAGPALFVLSGNGLAAEFDWSGAAMVGAAGSVCAVAVAWLLLAVTRDFGWAGRVDTRGGSTGGETL